MYLSIDSFQTSIFLRKRKKWKISPYITRTQGIASMQYSDTYTNLHGNSNAKHKEKKA
jgi:hypothetical protein